jgi:serine/threonine-protein kinase
MSMATVCLTCNHLNRENARFCRQCGTKLSQSVSVPSSQPNGQGSAEALTGRLPANTLLAGRYLILKKIGQGGMGAVYLVHDERLPGKMWAVKEMSESSATSPAERQGIIKDFQREAQLLASLNHPHIPKVIDSFNDRGRYYLVMEYVKGPTWRHLLNNRSEPFSEQEVRDLTSQLCDVLSYIHGHQPPIIFRDLKPANIMIDEGNQIKLIDFAIARLLKPGKGDTKSLGTMGYAAPEQYKGKTEPRSDIYALGVTLHELLTKHDPTTVMPLMPLPAVRQLNPAISKEMEQVITRSLELKLDKRWQSTDKMKAALTGSLRQDSENSRTGKKRKQSKSEESSRRGERHAY